MLLLPTPTEPITTTFIYCIMLWFYLLFYEIIGVLEVLFLLGVVWGWGWVGLVM
jgi:hypothetical protein